MFKYIALSFCIFFSVNVSALDVYEWTLDINTGSKHDNAYYGKDKAFNENNNGAGITYGFSNTIDFKVGYYENSYHRTSVYGGPVLNKDFYYHNDFVISPGVGLMFTTGYHGIVENAPVVAPIIHPSISFGFKTLRSTVGYIPYGENNVLTFQTQIQF